MFLKCQNFYTLGVEEYFTKSGYFTWRGCLTCEELVGVTHTTECVTDLFSFVDFEWIIL